MQPNCCHVSFAFILKFLNFLQAFVGVSIIIYSIWMLDQWNNHVPFSPPSLPPTPDSSSIPPLLTSPNDKVEVSYRDYPLSFAVNMVSGLDLNALKLPAPWFIYSFMGVGILLCCISFVGCIAAEAINGCCLCFYSVFTFVLFLVETALVSFIALDHRWEKDLPLDPTGELESLRSFIEDNIDICKWVGITVVTVQALALLLALILRAMISTQRTDLEDDDDYVNPRAKTWEPLLNSQATQMSGSSKGDGRGTQSDIWSSRIREKYGLNSSAEKYNV